jgi:RND family efflux transporter MFP subunit
MIPEGTSVKKGDVIARFDTTDLDEELRKHRADLETTLQTREKEERNLDVSLRQLKLDLVKAEGSLKKLEVELAVPQELVSSIEIQQLKLERDLARRRRDFLKEKIAFEQDLVKSKLELLDAKKEFYETKIAYSEETKEKFNVKAPVNGLVVYIPKHNGDRWEVGEGIWMLAKFLKIADISTLQVETNVLEVDSARIAVGQPSEVRVDAMPGLVLRSDISEIGRMVHEKSVQDPSKVFDAIMPLDPARHQLEGLRPGMGVQVVIETNNLPSRLTIPLNAVHGEGTETWVEVVDGGAFEKRVVKLGPRNADRVVVESGLEEGEIVTAGRKTGASA